MYYFILGCDASEICSRYSRFVRQASVVNVVHSIMFMNVIIFLKFNVFQEGNLNLIAKITSVLTSQKFTRIGKISIAWKV
jgi:hypothetical protein